MTLTTKLLLFLFALFTVSAVSFVIYKEFELSKKQNEIENSIILQKELVDKITRAMSQYSTKQDIEDFAKQNSLNLDAIKDDLKKVNATVEAVGVIVSKTKGQVVANLPSTGKGEVNPNPPVASEDPYGYNKETQVFQLNEKFKNIEVPMAKVGFSAWKDKPWDINIPSREYKINTVLGTDENEKHYFYNQFVISSEGKEYKVDIDSKFLEQYPDPTFHWFNPRLFMSVAGGGGYNINTSSLTGELTPAISVGIMSYGRSRVNPDLSILQVGIGYNTVGAQPAITVSPINYNLGKIFAPLVNSTYIGPAVSFGFKGQVSFGVGMSVGF